MVDFNGDGKFDEIDAAILKEEENEKKQPAFLCPIHQRRHGVNIFMNRP